MNGSVCGVGGLFSRCPEPPIDTCQYCGRGFCENHTEFRQGIDAVCAQKKCAAKIKDLLGHNVYKEDVARRNRSGLCGIEGCGPHPGNECSLCRGLFCRDHLQPRMYPFFNGYSTVDRPVSACAHCWQRRKLWRH